MSEDDLMHWQDALEAMRAGRTHNLGCPFCLQRTVSVTTSVRKTTLMCGNPNCRHFIEGRFNEDPDEP